MPELTDTSPEARQVLLEIYRRMSPEEKWRQMGMIYQTARDLHAAGVRLRNPDATDEDIRDAWMRSALGDDLARQVKESARESDPQ